MPDRIVFALLYLRNWVEFDCIHVRALAATRLDMALRRKTRSMKQRIRARRRGHP